MVTSGLWLGHSRLTKPHRHVRADSDTAVQSAHRKLLDTLNSVGLSDSLLRVIERRQTLDKWIVYGGMVSHHLLMYLVQ